MTRRFTYLTVVAVVAAASAAASVASASVAAGPHWLVQPTPNRAAPSNMLTGVSCTSGTFCMTVGASGPVGELRGMRLGARSVTTRTLAERWDGAHWRIVPTPNPAGSSNAMLNGLTCSSRRACTAVGFAFEGKIAVPLVERWSGSTWSIMKAPRPKTTFSDLASVSCPTSRECIAVGSAFNSSVASALAERWNGSRWTLAGEFRVGVIAGLSSVSCSSATRCTAVGAFETKTATFPLAERWTAGRWRKQATPGEGTLFSVSCPAFSDCTAVGTRPAAQPALSAVLAMQWNGSEWKTQSAPEPPGSPTEGLLLGVSCPTATSCEAGGWALLPNTTNAFTVADHWNGTSWKLEPTPALTGTLTAQFNGVWCGTHIACRAAGFIALPVGSARQNMTLAERR